MTSPPHAPLRDSSRPGALDGFRILDLSTSIAGAYCTKLLAAYGADVIKVERPGSGDPVRAYGPFASHDAPLETGAVHLYLNANKRSLTLDVNTITGQHLLGELAGMVDCIVDDRPVGSLDATGLTREVRNEKFPKLVTTLISAYGQDGPNAHLPATNLTQLATSGQMAITGEPELEPLKAGGYQAEYQAGLNGFAATLAGLVAASTSGIGDEIDMSNQEAMASTLEIMLPGYAYLQVDHWSERRGNIPSSAIGLYPCVDGYLGVHAMPRNFPALARLMDAEWMLTDERFSTSAARLQNEDELRAMLYAWALEQEKKPTYDRAGREHAPVAYVHEMPDLFESEHLKERGYFHDIEHPLAGTLKYPGAPILMTGTPWQEGRAPLLGEHTEEILVGLLGRTESDMTVLRGHGVI